MSGQNERTKAPTRATTATRPVKRDSGNVATVLRQVYEDAVKEAVPKEMLDLLSRLD